MNIYNHLTERLARLKEERSMDNSEVRNLVHNIINFVNDEVGRVLVECTRPAWSEANQTEMLTDAQARALSDNLSEAVKQAAFSVLQKS